MTTKYISIPFGKLLLFNLSLANCFGVLICDRVCKNRAYLHKTLAYFELQLAITLEVSQLCMLHKILCCVDTSIRKQIKFMEFV